QVSRMPIAPPDSAAQALLALWTGSGRLRALLARRPTSGLSCGHRIPCVLILQTSARPDGYGDSSVAGCGGGVVLAILCVAWTAGEYVRVVLYSLAHARTRSRDTLSARRPARGQAALHRDRGPQPDSPRHGRRRARGLAGLHREAAAALWPALAGRTGYAARLD